jgi:hypothetical protein
MKTTVFQASEICSDERSHAEYLVPRLARSTVAMADLPRSALVEIG